MVREKLRTWLVELPGRVLMPLIWLSLAPVTFAYSNRVGVLRSPENQEQMEAIVTRMQNVGVNFCILDSQNWQGAEDLSSLGVLLIPNVGSFNGAQVEGLREWMARGGKVVATGPTGNLALSDARDQLRSLLGAYWGFSNSRPSTLKIVASPELQGVPSEQFTSTLVGGVLVPSGTNSQTAAVWIADGQTPAVIVSKNSTFLGWRWGVDNVASVDLDVAWLEASLRHFGVSTSLPGGLIPSDNISPPESCNPPSDSRPFPILSPVDQQPREIFTPQSRQPEPSSPLSPPSIASAVAPLSTLIAERSDVLPARPLAIAEPVSPPVSAIQTTISEPAISEPADAESISIPAPAGQTTQSEAAIVPAAPKILPESAPPPILIADSEQSFLPGASGSPNSLSLDQLRSMDVELKQLIARFESTLLAAEANNPASTPPSSGTRRSYTTLVAARQNLHDFQQLVNRQQYDRARQLWLKTRRELWDNYPTDRPFAQPEIRAIWFDRGTIVRSQSEAELAKVFDRIAAAGINTVFFEAINASYPIYPSKIAPEQNPLTVGWDPLKAAVKLAHERKMELHAWTWIFAAANQGHNRVLGLPEEYLGPVLSRRPDWAITDQKGNIFDRGPQFKKAFFDPANPEVQRYILSLLEEIANNYDVDGIHVDYIRYPFQDGKFNQTFGYSAASRKLFKDMTGTDPLEIPAGSELWSRWTAFRMHQVDSFMASLSTRLKRQHPQLILSASVFPMEQRDRIFRLQQNWEEWMRRGWVDLVVIMTYALDTGNLEDRIQPLSVPSRQESALIIPGLRLLKVPDSVTVDQLQLVRNLPTGGFALFATENLTANLETILNRIQTSSHPEPIPYRQPFVAAADRFQSLQREWQLLRDRGQLAMASPRLRVWSQEGDRVALALQQLASQPSPQHLRQAQTALAKFQQQFSGWMQQQQQAYPYLVAGWENRLTALNKLLTYGDRFVLQERRS